MGSLFALNPAGTLPVLTGPYHPLDLILLEPEGFLVSTLPGKGCPADFLTSGPGNKGHLPPLPALSTTQGSSSGLSPIGAPSSLSV